MVTVPFRSSRASTKNSPGVVDTRGRSRNASRSEASKRGRVSLGVFYAENEVPQPQLDLALGLPNVKPPVNPSVT